jgi:tRNA threonylcarbamoyladenosine biosynthesis protein TsaB
MRVLAIESATIGVGVAVVDELGVRSVRNVLPGRLQTETLHPMIIEVMNESRTEMSALDAIVVDIGPGLFTGLRVGITTAKTLAFALNIPVVGCGSTEALLAGVVADQRGVAIIDMRRSEVVYAKDNAPKVPILCTPAECAEMLVADKDLVGAVIVGDGVTRHAEIFAEVIATQMLSIDEQQRFVDASLLGALGIKSLDEGNGMDAAQLVPMYLRDADAKINWSSRDLSQVKDR